MERVVGSIDVESELTDAFSGIDRQAVERCAMRNGLNAQQERAAIKSQRAWFQFVARLAASIAALELSFGALRIEQSLRNTIPLGTDGRL